MHVLIFCLPAYNLGASERKKPNIPAAPSNGLPSQAVQRRASSISLQTTVQHTREKTRLAVLTRLL